MIKLSILIRTIPGREAKLQELLEVIYPQVKAEDVEIIIDDTYPLMMGTKCNRLVEKAQGEYVVFIDDDDLVPEYYVQKFLDAMATKPDCISIEGVCRRQDMDNKEIYRYVQGLHFKWEFVNDTLLTTNVTQIAAVKKSISVQCPFPDIMYYEDRFFADQLDKIAKSEVHIKQTMYVHRYSPVKEYKY